MRRFCIDSSVLGTNKHLVGDHEGYSWSESVPKDSWHLTGKIKTASTIKCLDTLFRLVGHEQTTVPVPYLTAINTLITGSIDISIPWAHVLPQNKFRLFFQNILKETTDLFPTLPFDYAEGAWPAGSRVLSCLKPAKIDLDVLQEEINLGINVPVLESFRPKRSGFTHPIVYDRFSTRTGRLTVSEGPNILTLKKSARRVIESSFDSGVICYLDFRALEPRIMLAECGKSSNVDDLYEDVAQNVLGGSVQRDTAKIAVLAELYGISRSSLQNKLGVSGKKLDGFIGAINDHFGIENLKSRLKEQFSQISKIKNKFGRPIEIPSGQDNLLVNSYVQSSGVDVAMIGFDDILRRLGTDGIRPLFVLHDAIILDVRPDRLSDVELCTSVDIPAYSISFPLKFEKLI